LGQDARVRQALELSIDRVALNQVVFNGEYQPGNQWVPPTNPYYVKELPIPARDVAKAKALLAAAGAPNPVVETMAVNSPELLQAAQVIQAMAKESGFDIPDERLAHYRNVAKHTIEDLPIIYLWHNRWLWAFSTKLSGFAPSPDGLIRPQGLQLK